MPSRSKRRLTFPVKSTSSSPPQKSSCRKRKRRSKFEYAVQAVLDKRPDIEAQYEPRKLPYVLALEYTPDWECVLVHQGPVSFYLEAKGKFDYEERRKALAVISNNPGIDLRFVFMRDNKLNKRSQTRYTDWCKQHNIRCSVFPKLPLD